MAVCGQERYYFDGAQLLFQRARPKSAPLHHRCARFILLSSGHALGSTTVMGCLVVLAHASGYPWLAPAVTSCARFIVGVAASRVYFGAYASDVLASAGRGRRIAAVTGWFYPRLLPGKRRWERRLSRSCVGFKRAGKSRALRSVTVIASCPPPRLTSSAQLVPSLSRLQREHARIPRSSKRPAPKRAE